jgi:hypothetical protein
MWGPGEVTIYYRAMATVSDGIKKRQVRCSQDSSIRRVCRDPIAGQAPLINLLPFAVVPQEDIQSKSKGTAVPAEYVRKRSTTRSSPPSGRALLAYARTLKGNERQTLCKRMRFGGRKQ